MHVSDGRYIDILSIQPIIVYIDIVSYQLPSTKDIDMVGHTHLLQFYNLISHEFIIRNY